MLNLPHGLADRLGLSTETLGAGLVCDGRPLTVGLLNLMPHKAVTDTDISRALSHARCPLRLIPLRIKGQTYKTTPVEYVDNYYTDFDAAAAAGLDRLIVTGAPLEQMPYGEVRYWPQLCRIMDWADRYVERTLYICWGAQAALWHFYGIDKRPLPGKCFGIFTHRNLHAELPLMARMGETFPMPHSRHTTVSRDEILAAERDGLLLLAESAESGPGIAGTRDARRTFVFGHFEYGPATLDNEYHRDLSRGLPIHAPLHYYAPDGTVDYTWREAAETFYTDWVTP